MVVLSDREAVFELLSRKGALYNDRPPDRQIEAALQHENMSFMYEGPMWRVQRKIVSTYLSPKNLDTVLQPIQIAEYEPPIIVQINISLIHVQSQSTDARSTYKTRGVP